MTSDPKGWLFKHLRDRDPKSFAVHDNLYRLVYDESYPTPAEAIDREEQPKGWGREKRN